MSANNNYQIYTERVEKQVIDDLLGNADLKNEFHSILQAYKKGNKNNKHKVQYCQKYKNIGRYYASDNNCITLQNMPRQLRNTLAKDNYIDLDMVNALPTILYEECKKNDIKTTYLRRYNKARDDKLQELQTEYNCDRDIAKQLPNRLMNGGGIPNWIKENNLDIEEECEIPEFWVLFKKEMDTIYKGLYKIYYNDYKVVLDREKGKCNDTARLVSIALQDKENNILQEAIKFLTSLEFVVDVPIHDGMLVQIKPGLDDVLINELQDYIKEECGYTIYWKIKPMEDIIRFDTQDIIDDWTFSLEKSEVYDASYCMSIGGDTQNQVFSRRKKYVENFLIQTFHPDNLFHFKNYKSTTTSMFKRQGIIERLEDTYSGIFSDNTGKELKFTDVWLSRHNKNTAQSYYWLPMNPTNDFHLNNIQPDMYNTFNGYGKDIDVWVNPDATRMLDLWKEVVYNLCGGDDYCYHYYICYLAQMIQDPSNKKGIAIGFKSKQGEGKGQHLAAVSRVIGKDHYYSSENMDDFFGKHSEAFPKRILVNIDEVNCSHNYLNSIKTKITEDTCVLNAKNLRPITINNFARIIFTMNGVNMSFDMGSEDRRFVFFESNGKNLKFKKYKGGWERIVEHWKSPQHTAALFEYLNNYIVDVDIINDRPITELYKTLLYKNKPYICSYWEQFLYGCKWREFEPYTLGYEEQTEPVMVEDEYYNQPISVKASALRKDLNSYLKNCGYEFQLTPAKILPEFKNLNFPIEYCMKGGNNVFTFIPKNIYDYMVERKWIEQVLLTQTQVKEDLLEYDNNLFIK